MKKRQYIKREVKNRAHKKGCKNKKCEGCAVKHYKSTQELKNAGLDICRHIPLDLDFTHLRDREIKGLYCEKCRIPNGMFSIHEEPKQPWYKKIFNKIRGK